MTKTTITSPESRLTGLVDRRSPAGAAATAVRAWHTVRTAVRRRQELADFNRAVRSAPPNVRTDMLAAATRAA